MKTLRFALMMRYTSNTAYRYFRYFLPLPSYSLLHKLSSQDIDTTKALVTLRINQQFGNDFVLLLDEMYLQQQVQYDGQTLTGCDSNFQMYRSILCYMVVSLTRSFPFVIKAVPLTKISSDIVRYN